MISPPLQDWDDLRQPPTDGEREVANLFCRDLDLKWEIYFQPHLNGLKPDFVLLNPNVGVAVFEVKDWDLDLMTYEPATSRNDSHLTVRDRGGRVFRKESPVAQTRRYQREFERIYLPSLYGKRLAAITAGVIFTRAPGGRVRNLLAPDLDKVPDEIRRYRPISGSDALHGKDLVSIFPEYSRRSSQHMNETLADEMRDWLREPQHSRDQRRSVPLDVDQRALAQSRTESGFRRIRGPAGSGKSAVLAQRAANLTEEGKQVLVVSFNHTLRPYLQDLVVRAGGNRNTATWLGFHEWCRRTMAAAGRSAAYAALWKKEDYEANPGHDEVLDRKLALETIDALETGPTRAEVQRFDAILVDEGQDFLPEWWEALRHVRREGGEMLLVADRSQDIYRRSSAWTEEVMKGSGFVGPWNDLARSYRMPSALTELLTAFQRRHRPSGIDVAPVLFDQQEILLRLRWRQIAPGKEIRTVLEELDEVVRGGAYSDVGIMTTTRDQTQSITQALNGREILAVSTVAEDGDQGKERMMKRYFYQGREAVKVTPIPNFKGWEISRLVVLLTDDNASSAYAALSRLSIGDFGSALSVVNTVPSFEEFGRTWPEFISGT